MRTKHLIPQWSEMRSLPCRKEQVLFSPGTIFTRNVPRNWTSGLTRLLEQSLPPPRWPTDLPSLWPGKLGLPDPNGAPCGKPYALTGPCPANPFPAQLGDGRVSLPWPGHWGKAGAPYNKTPQE